MHLIFNVYVLFMYLPVGLNSVLSRNFKWLTFRFLYWEPLASLILFSFSGMRKYRTHNESIAHTEQHIKKSYIYLHCEGSRILAEVLLGNLLACCYSLVMNYAQVKWKIIQCCPCNILNIRCQSISTIPLEDWIVVRIQ